MASSSASGQQRYTPTQYEANTWEIIGEYQETQYFIPDQFQVLGGQTLTVDPMFANYGGLPPPAEHRTHAPVSLTEMSSSVTATQEEEIDTRIKIEPQELERIVAQAREEGRVAALEDAIMAHQSQLEQLRQQIDTIIQDIHRQTQEQQRALEAQALELSLSITDKLISHAVEINPEYLVPILSEALSKVGTASIQKVRVSPEDLEFINIIGIESRIREFDGSWTFEADPSVRSGCVVETTAGQIDYQLDQAFERVRDQIIKIKDSRG
jgi:flagellar biosynthesis/type III secretory pathway protein FliH